MIPFFWGGVDVQKLEWGTISAIAVSEKAKERAWHNLHYQLGRRSLACILKSGLKIRAPVLFKLLRTHSCFLL